MQKLLYPNLWKGCIGAWCPSQQRFPSNQLVDYSANNNHGTLTSMDAASDWVASQGKMALDFDGSNDRVSVQLTGPITNTITIAAWAYPRSLAQYEAIAFSRVGGGFGLLVNGAGNVLTGMWDGTEFGAATGLLFSLNEWQFCAMVVRGTSSVIYMGNGGAVKAFVITISNTSRSIATRFDLGVDDNGGTRFWDGLIDDVRVYNRALTPSEIATLALRRGIAYEQVRNRKYKAAGGGGGGFKPYWASNNSASIGCGV
jgi:hypothetical protein